MVTEGKPDEAHLRPTVVTTGVRIILLPYFKEPGAALRRRGQRSAQAQEEEKTLGRDAAFGAPAGSSAHACLFLRLGCLERQLPKRAGKGSRSKGRGDARFWFARKEMCVGGLAW